MEKKDNVKTLLIVGLILEIIVVLLVLGFMIFDLSRPKQEVHYNIDHVDTIVIPEKKDEEPKIFTTEPNVEQVPELKKTYDVDEFKFINYPVYGYTGSWDHQKMLYDAAVEFNVNYIQLLSIYYNERAYGNSEAIHYNNNGTYDIGIMQINSSHKKILKKLTGSDDLSQLTNDRINIRCAAYIVKLDISKELVDYDIWTSLVAYNGGYGTVEKIANNEYSKECMAGKYATTVMDEIMDPLYKKYLEDI